jgi:hypothetical protein
MPVIVPFPSTPTPPPTVSVQSPPVRLIVSDGGLTVTIGTVETVTTLLGRSSPRTDGAATGSATITVDDTARVLDADNTSSPLYGHLTPGGTSTPQVQAWNGTTWVPLFTGLIESIQTSWPGGTSRSDATLSLVDQTRDLTLHVPPAKMTYPMQQSGTRISQMLIAPSRSAWGWINRAPSGSFALDFGQKVLGPLTTDGTTSTWQYVSDAASAEKGLIFFDQAGICTYQDQLHRYRSSTPNWVFGDDPTAEVWVDPDLQYMLSNDRVITDVAYSTSDGQTSGYGPNGVFFWETDSDVGSTTQVSPVATQLADQMQGLARARWEYTHYSINRRDAPTVAINALGDPLVPSGLNRFNAALNVKIGDYVQLNRRPGVGATLTKYYWVDAIAHNIAYDSWTTTFTLVAADQIPAVWKLGTTKLTDVTAPLPW